MKAYWGGLFKGKTKSLGCRTEIPGSLRQRSDAVAAEEKLGASMIVY